MHAATRVLAAEFDQALHDYLHKPEMYVYCNRST